MISSKKTDLSAKESSAKLTSGAKGEASQSFECGCKKDVSFNIETMNKNCPLVFDIIARSPIGVFQIEGPTARKWIGQFRPSSISDLADFTSLARTGPLKAGMMEEYIAVKLGRKPASFLHPDLESILGPTFGALVYQEQIMELAWQIAGLDLVEADKIRKAVGKKLPEQLAEMKEKFVGGCLQNGYSADMSNQIWDWILPMSGYAFNKSHAVCYATLAYKTAWAKTHYTTEFFTALLNKSGTGSKEQTDQILTIVNDGKLMEIEVLPPSIDEITMDFKIVGDRKIAFGLSHIKGIGKSTYGEVKKCKVKTYRELVTKFFDKPAKKTVLDALIWSGALDKFGVSRYNMCADFNLLRELTPNEKKVVQHIIKKGGEFNLPKITEQLLTCDKSLFEEVGVRRPTTRRAKTVGELIETHVKYMTSESIRGEISFEKFYIGISFLAGGESYEDDYTPCIEFVDAPDGSRFIFASMIEKVRKHVDKNGNDMAFVAISDSSYMVDSCVIFSRQYGRFHNLLKEENVVRVIGYKQGNSFILNKIERL
jgi:DNA polymerase-3 subunit alpha